jgi:hypothetical protein
MSNVFVAHRLLLLAGRPAHLPRFADQNPNPRVGGVARPVRWRNHHVPDWAASWWGTAMLSQAAARSIDRRSKPRESPKAAGDSRAKPVDAPAER